MEILSENALVSVYRVELPPKSIGVDIKFRNEAKEPARIEVAAVRGPAAARGIVGGDILVRFGRYALPIRTSALELEYLVGQQSRMGENRPIDVVMWRNKRRFSTRDPLNGEEILVRLTPQERATDALWASMKIFDHSTNSERTLHALARGPPSQRRTFEQGLVVVGIDHDPLPDALDLEDFKAALAQRQLTGTSLLLNCWRVKSRRTHDHLIKRCQAAIAQAPSTPWQPAVGFCTDPLTYPDNESTHNATSDQHDHHMSRWPLCDFASCA